MRLLNFNLFMEEFYILHIIPSALTAFRAGFSIYDLGYSFPVSIVTVFNRKSPHHIELNYGLNLIVKEQTTFLPWPILNSGYRYQKLTGKGIVFRAGIGLEYIGPYVGLGYSF